MSVERSAWLLVEVGGSSIQTARRDPFGRFWFTPGLVLEPEHSVALACPGVVRDGRVLHATNLGWPDDADPGEELGIERLSLVANDAVAAALGESVLRGRHGPEHDLIYVSLGTGVGSAQVIDGVASELDLGHRFIGGDAYCDGCRSTGCLNSELSAHRLPAWLAPDDHERVARTLASSLRGIAPDGRTPVVLGGGIVRRHAAIASILDGLIPNPVQLSMAPAEAKSAAYAGLDHLTRVQRA